MPDTPVRTAEADACDAPPGASFRPLPPSPAPWRRLGDLVRAHLAERPRWVTAVAVAAVAIVVVVALTVRASGGAPAPPDLSLPRAGTAPPADAGPPASAAQSTSPGTQTTGPAGPVVVHVAGAVARPGVYSLATGSRVNDAVAAAGGPGVDADLDQLDLAAHVSDGDRVYVPRRGEQAVPAAGVAGQTAAGGATAGAIVDINAADAQQLDALPGVGPSLAGAIVEYRRQHGRFRTVQDLLQVPGIGDAKLAALRARVKVGP